MIRQESTGSVDQVMTALRELEETLTGAQRLLGDRCMVNRQFLLQRLEIIGRCLPDALKQAAALVQQEKDIREAAQREAAEQTRKSREEGQKIIDDAKKKAEELQADSRKNNLEAQKSADAAKQQANALKGQAENDARAIRQQAQQEAQAYLAKAQQDAQAIRQQAQAEAQRMLAQADASARAAVSQDNVHRMAVVEADELRDTTNQEMLMLRQQCVDYLDSILEDADRYLVSLTTDIRKQRQALDSRR
ncbi:MAG: hypothetical protein ACI4MG_03955 [Aristaeellaceae bacterium]